MTKFRMDTHMHFDLYKDRNAVLDYIENFKSYTIAVTNLPDLYEHYYHMQGSRKHIQYALGFHPELVQKYANQIQKFDRLISTTRFIGEVGLDYSSKDSADREVQEKIFEHIIKKCGQEGNKIITVHSRRAEKAVLDILKNLSSCSVILHWYSGSLFQMDEALRRGYYFSINQQMINSVNGRKIINHIPMERILIESDAPFTNGLRDNYSVDFMDPIYRYLCDSKQLSETEMSVLLKQNFKNLLNGK